MNIKSKNNSKRYLMKDEKKRINDWLRKRGLLYALNQKQIHRHIFNKT